MVTTTRGHEIDREQPLGLRWLPFVNRAVFLRSAIVAVVKRLCFHRGKAAGEPARSEFKEDSRTSRS